MGVSSIEAGFPSNPLDYERVVDIAQKIGTSLVEVTSWSDGKRLTGVSRPVRIVGLSTFKPQAIESTYEALSSATLPTITMIRGLLSQIQLP